VRILVIAPTPFFADRGCHVRILGEAKALQQLGHAIQICTYHLGKNIPGLETVRTMRIPWYKKLSAGPSVHKFYLDLLLLWKVLLCCRRFRPDILHAHLHEGIVIGKVAGALFRIPMVADLQGSLTEELLDHRFIPRWGWLVGLCRWVERKINELPHHLITSSFRTAQLMLEKFALEQSRVTAIGDGVDLDVFYPRMPDPDLRAKLGIAPSDKVVVFLGVLTPYQGIDLLLEMIPSIVRAQSRVKFLVLGFPEEQYRARAKSLGIDHCTIFTGKVSHADAPEYLALGTIAISPKMSMTEANLKLFTYMAMGLPTVVFDSPVNREILGDLGIYAAYGDPVSFAEAIVELLRDERKARDLGRLCYQKAVEWHSWKVVGDRLTELYEHVAGSSMSLESCTNR
jgi:glycosyltransferase involved in cell wall biosynthesis